MTGDPTLVESSQCSYERTVEILRRTGRTFGRSVRRTGPIGRTDCPIRVTQKEATFGTTGSTGHWTIGTEREVFGLLSRTDSQISTERPTKSQQNASIFVKAKMPRPLGHHPALLFLTRGVESPNCRLDEISDFQFID